jgi:hypothetical protein
LKRFNAQNSENLGNSTISVWKKNTCSLYVITSY